MTSSAVISPCGQYRYRLERTVDIHVPFSANLGIGAWFTLISVVRGYVIRRWFNARLRQAAQSLASHAG